MIEHVIIEPSLCLYDRRQVLSLLRSGTPSQLRRDLESGDFGARLHQAQRQELDDLLHGWEQRALGLVSLRDALLVDNERGPRVYNLICAALTVDRLTLAPELARYLKTAPDDVRRLPPQLAADTTIAAFAARAQREHLALVWQSRSDSFPTPPNLDTLLPTLPRTARNDYLNFEQPSGWRGRIAVGLVVVGLGLLGTPLLSGRFPESPARWPLALFTLALMIGIRSGPSGFIGAACIWMVANLPVFRHGLALSQLWPVPILLSAGLIFLMLDQRVRTMWRWLRRRFWRRI